MLVTSQLPCIKLQYVPPCQVEGLNEMLKANASLKTQVDGYASRTELDRYGVFYCGNNWAVAKSLKAACVRAGVSFSHEAFGDW
jgi:hypothetical protein